jgi:hypothetical protein
MHTLPVQFVGGDQMALAAHLLAEPVHKENVLYVLGIKIYSLLSNLMYPDDYYIYHSRWLANLSPTLNTAGTINCRVTFACQLTDETGSLAVTAYTEDAEKLLQAPAEDIFHMKHDVSCVMFSIIVGL